MIKEVRVFRTSPVDFESSPSKYALSARASGAAASVLLSSSRIEDPV